MSNNAPQPTLDAAMVKRLERATEYMTRSVSDTLTACSVALAAEKMADAEIQSAQISSLMISMATRLIDAGLTDDQAVQGFVSAMQQVRASAPQAPQPQRR